MISKKSTKPKTNSENRFIKVESKNSKVKLFILILFNIVIIGALLAGFFIAPKYTKKDVSLRKDVVFELNKEMKIKDAVNVENGVTLLNGDDVIATDKIGSTTIEVKYRKNGKENTFKFNLEIEDTRKPIIDSEDKITIYTSSDVDFKDYIKVSDNSNKDIEPIIKGEYDLSTPGEYEVTITAKDPSGNEASKDVVIKVTDLTLKTNGYYVYKTKDVWHEFQFQKDNKAGYYPWFCPGFGCGGYSETGSYETKGNKIIMTLTKAHDELGEVKKINNVYEFTYVNENEIKYDGNTYKWQKEFDSK